MVSIVILYEHIRHESQLKSIFTLDGVGSS